MTSTPLGNLEGDTEAWKIRVIRGPLQGVKFFEVMIQSRGAYSGGETDGEWFGQGECRYDSPRENNLLKYLVEDSWLRDRACSQADVALAVDLLAYHGISANINN